jgi:hypothetical protein
MIRMGKRVMCYESLQRVPIFSIGKRIGPSTEGMSTTHRARRRHREIGAPFEPNVGISEVSSYHIRLL